MAADRERQARRTHLQRAILELRSQQASELARDLLTTNRPKVTAAETRRPATSEQRVGRRPLRRAASARTARDRRPVPQWMERERNKDFRDVDEYLSLVRVLYDTTRYDNDIFIYTVHSKADIVSLICLTVQ